MELSAFIRAYIVAALWTSEETLKEEGLENGGSLDDISETLLGQIKADCEKFCATDAYNAAIKTGLWSEEQAGHDFWLTRNGHGTGFWDRYQESNNKAGFALGEILSTEAKKFPMTDIYVGDNGKIY